jgi:hypothetical protein
MLEIALSVAEEAEGGSAALLAGTFSGMGFVASLYFPPLSCWAAVRVLAAFRGKGAMRAAVG